MNKLLIKLGQLPIGNILDYALVVALIGIVVMLTGCATPTVAQSEAMNRHDADAAMFKMLEAAAKHPDPETARLAVIMAAMSRLQAPSPIQEQRKATPADMVFAVFDRVFSSAERIAAPLLAYKGQKDASQASVAVAGINRDVSVANINGMVSLGAAGSASVAQLGTAAVNALSTVANRPATPTTQVTVTGNSGPVQVGSGTQTNSSNNPVNPAPVVCVSGTSGTTCSR